MNNIEKLAFFIKLQLNCLKMVKFLSTIDFNDFFVSFIYVVYLHNKAYMVTVATRNMIEIPQPAADILLNTKLCDEGCNECVHTIIF